MIWLDWLRCFSLKNGLTEGPFIFVFLVYFVSIGLGV